MNKNITKEQIYDALFGVFLVSLTYTSIDEIAWTIKGENSNGDKVVSLKQLVTTFLSAQEGEESNEKGNFVTQSRQISEDDLKDTLFITSSQNLDLYSVGEQRLPEKFDLIKDGLKSMPWAKISMFINKKTKQLYLVNSCADISESSNGIDIALCGKESLDKNNIDITSIPKASYWDAKQGKKVEMDNITLDNLGEYDPCDYFIKRFKKYDESCQNNGQDLDYIFKYFESKGISRSIIDYWMARRLLIGRAEALEKKLGIKIDRVIVNCYSFGANRELGARMLDDMYDINTAGYKYKCISVNGLVPTDVQKKFFNDKIGKDRVDNIVDSVLKVKGTRDWVAPVGSDASTTENTIFFRTDRNAGKSHSTFSLRTDEGPVKPGALYEFYRYFYESMLCSISDNLKDNKAYAMCHAFLAYFIYGKDHNGNKIEVKKWDIFVAVCVIAKSGIYACSKFVFVKIKRLFVRIFSRDKNKQEIEIIDAPGKENDIPEKENSKEEDHNKENEIAEDQRIPKMENDSHKEKDRNDDTIK